MVPEVVLELFKAIEVEIFEDEPCVVPNKKLYLH